MNGYQKTPVCYRYHNLILKANMGPSSVMWKSCEKNLQILECAAVSELELIIKLKHKRSTKVEMKKRKEMNLMDILETNFQQYKFN